MKELGGIAAAVRALRDRLGETQSGMARLLGISLRTYDRWEAGDTIPRGNTLVKLIDLCPDEQTRALFHTVAASHPRSHGIPSSSKRGAPEDRLRMRFRNSCLEAIEIIYESAVLGSMAADEKLRKYADELNRNAALLARGLVDHRKGTAE